MLSFYLLKRTVESNYSSFFPDFNPRIFRLTKGANCLPHFPLLGRDSGSARESSTHDSVFGVNENSRCGILLRMALATESYLKPEIIRQVQRFDLKAKFVMEGFLSGLHGSPFKGFSVEFSEHRKYVRGDDV